MDGEKTKKKYARESEFRKKDLKQKKLKKQNFVQIELHCRAYKLYWPEGQVGSDFNNNNFRIIYQLF